MCTTRIDLSPNFGDGPQLLGVCYESTFTEKLLRECKKATSKAVKPIDDIIKVGVVSGCGLGVA